MSAIAGYLNNVLFRHIATMVAAILAVPGHGTCACSMSAFLFIVGHFDNPLARINFASIGNKLDYN